MLDLGLSIARAITEKSPVVFTCGVSVLQVLRCDSQDLALHTVMSGRPVGGRINGARLRYRLWVLKKEPNQ
jgi:hypothetical protein